MRYVWVAVAFVGVLAVGLLVGIVLGRSGEQGSAAPRTVTVEKTVPARTSSPTTTSSSSARTTPAGSVDSLNEARAAFEGAVTGYGNSNLEVSEVMEMSCSWYKPPAARLVA